MSANWQYGIVFTGYNYVSSATTEVCNNIQQVQYQVNGLNWGVQNMGVGATRSFRNLAFGAQMGLFYVSMLAGGLNRTESAEIGVEMAQERLNEAIKKYGANSTEAQKATQQLERAQLYYQRAAQYSTLITASLGVQAISMGAMLIKYAIPALTALTTSFHTAAAAASTLWAMLGPWGWAVLGIGAAVGIGATAYALTRPVEINTNLNVSRDTDIDAALDEYKRRLKRTITSGGYP